MIREVTDPPKPSTRSPLEPTARSTDSNNPRQLLSVSELSRLNERSNLKGILQAGGHSLVLVCSGLLWANQHDTLWVALPALLLYGFSLATLFAPMHECVHRTAFQNPRFNDVVAWIAGLLSFYNSTFFRRYHKWHHRYTQIPGKDPELSDPVPQTLREYLLHLSGIRWWMGKVKTHLQVARGQMQDFYFIPESAYPEVIRSTRLQLLTYLGAIALSTALGHPEGFWLYWVLPLALGQPFLRAILLAEHTGCTQDDNPLTNTRTTYTLWPLRFLMWNMPYHAEHHLYPSIPFHALAIAHQSLASHLTQIGQGYIQVNRALVTTFGKETA
jgi:fatty acid desaturase